VPRAGAPFAQRQNLNRIPVAPERHTVSIHAERIWLSTRGQARSRRGRWQLLSRSRDAVAAHCPADRCCRCEIRSSLVTAGSSSSANGTSVAAPKIAHLGGLIQREIPNASVDLMRALIVTRPNGPTGWRRPRTHCVCSGTAFRTPIGPLRPGGARCLITIEERIPIGTAQYFRIPFPAELYRSNSRSPASGIGHPRVSGSGPQDKCQVPWEPSSNGASPKSGSVSISFEGAASTVNPAASAGEEEELEDQPGRRLELDCQTAPPHPRHGAERLVRGARIGFQR